MQFYFWDNSLNLLETVTIKDDLPYINMRSRMISEENYYLLITRYVLK